MCDGKGSDMGEQLSLSSLIWLMANGDGQECVLAWSVFCDYTRDPVLGYLIKTIDGLDLMTLEGITQEVLLVAYLKAHQYKGAKDSVAKSWLNRIARNEALIYLKKDSLLFSLEDSGEALGVSTLREQIAERDWDEFLNSLTEQQNLVAELRFKYGLSQKQIADDLGLSAGRVSQIVKVVKMKAKTYFNL